MKCLRCGDTKKTAGTTGFCSKCLTAIDTEAQTWQENDYLIRYLATREDDFRRSTVRLRKMAKRLKLKLSAVPEPMVYADRVARVRAHYTGVVTTRGAKKGTKKGKVA